MATIYSCDECKEIILKQNLIAVRMPDGEHPHNNKQMTAEKDFCPRCIQNKVINLRGDWKALCLGDFKC